MKKCYLVGLALCALFAVSAFGATAAFAESPEWLVGGATVTSSKLVLAEGEFNIEDIKGGLFLENAALKCSGLAEGFVESGGQGLITKDFDLAGKESPPTPIKCTNVLNCPEPSEETPIGLPTTTQLELVGTVLEEKETPTGSSLGWNITCFGISDSCTMATSNVEVALLVGPPEDVDSISKEPITAALGCARGGVGSGLVKGEILVFSDEGALTVND